MFHVKQRQSIVSRETTPSASSAAVAQEFDVSRETMMRLQTYADLLLRWNERINLISRGDAAHVWTRHIADSLQLKSLLPQGVSDAIDLGSGAGFPGLVLAIATGVGFQLIESDHRKCAFLREAARHTAAPISVTAARIEASDATAPLITARALAPLSALLDLTSPHLSPGGICLFPKGVGVEAELTDAHTVWNMKVERHQSRIDPHGCILRISEVSRV